MLSGNTKKKEKIDQIPLNVYLSRGGVCSRRAAVEIIKTGDVTVNGKVVKEPGFKVLPDDVVKYKEEIIDLEQKVYILLNKPRGYVTTASDEYGRKTVLDLVAYSAQERLYPVGRLDRDTTGLLVITNDGYLSQKLAHPKNKVTKRYYVTLDRPVALEDIERLKKGVFLEDGKSKFDKITVIKSKLRKHIIVEIHGGKNRIIKRMFKHFGYKVVGLDRFEYAGLKKGSLAIGRWRYLEDHELQSLQNYGKSKL